MYRDEDEDLLIRQIRQFAEALGALLRGGRPSSVQLEDLVRDSIGLRLQTLDALSARALASLGDADDPRWLDKLELIASVLEQLAANDPDRTEDRRTKAVLLRQILGRPAPG